MLKRSCSGANWSVWKTGRVRCWSRFTRPWKQPSQGAGQRTSKKPPVGSWPSSPVQHGKHENRNLYDQVTKKRLKQYKLPFKVFTVPPLSINVFKYIKGARRLSDWVYGCQESMDSQDRPRSMGFPYGIIAQKLPELVAASSLAEAAVAKRQAVWERVRARAHRQSVGLRTAQNGSEDAELWEYKIFNVITGYI